MVRVSFAVLTLLTLAACGDATGVDDAAQTAQGPTSTSKPASTTVAPAPTTATEPAVLDGDLPIGTATYEVSLPDFMSEALATQALRNASELRELTVGEHRVIEVQLSVPDDLDLSTCDVYQGSPYLQSWAPTDGSIARYHQGPGQRDLVRLVDVDGELFSIDAATWPELPARERDEVTAILDSITFEAVPS